MQVQGLEAALETFLAYSPQPCLLLASVDVARLDVTVEALQTTYDWPLFAVGRELSPVLWAEAVTRRGNRAARWLEHTVRTQVSGPVLVTGIALLFEPALQLDPLALLCRVGRYVPLIVAWPGTYDGDLLTYAVPEHAHYRVWRKPAALVVPLD